MDLTIIKNELTMSSREIAELCGKEHAHVMRDIRDISDELGGSIFGLAEYTDKQGKKRDMYLLNKKNTLLLVSGYSVILRQKIIDRLEELEEQQLKPALPQTYVEALKELVVTLEENERLKSINHALIHTQKTWTTRELAKELNLRSAQQLNELLKNKGIQYKQNGTWLLSSKYSNLGFVEIKQNTKDQNGKLIDYYNAQWTLKGRQFVLALFNKEIH